MGTYGLSGEEIKDKFRKFLIDTSSGEGDISAHTIKDAWNMIAKEEGWNDRLQSYEDEAWKDANVGGGEE